MSPKRQAKGVQTMDDLDDLGLDASDVDAMLIALGGFASAWGDGATSRGDVWLDIVDEGTITWAQGDATFTSEGGETGIADTFVDVVGADTVVSTELNFDWGSAESGLIDYTVFSMTRFVAVDLEDGLFAQLADAKEEVVTIDSNLSLLSFAAEIDDPVTLHTQVTAIEDVMSTVTLEGLSDQTQLSLSADVWGIDTLASIDGFMIEVDDDFSAVGGVVIGAA